MNKTISHRYDFVLAFEVVKGNPNGDPDAGNAPRIDPETGHGLVSDVCIERKIRNYVCLAKTTNGEVAPGYDIYVKEKAVLNQQHLRAYTAKKLDPDAKCKEKAEQVSEARAWMCQTFFDIRMFGAVMRTEVNCGQVRGPVQIAFARSVDPIVHWSRQSAEWQSQTSVMPRKERTIGHKEIVPSGLYVAHGIISPHLAADTGFSEDDLTLLWDAIQGMFEQDRSAARGEMATRKLIVLQHESPLGNAPARLLFDRVRVMRKDPSAPARCFADYTVEVDRSELKTGVTVLELL